MHKPTAKVWDVPSGLSAALAVTSLCFFLGGCLGCLLAVRVGGGGNDLLAEYLTSFYRKSVQAQPASPPLLLGVGNGALWPLLVFGLGFTTLGLLAIPLVFSVRGFLLAFSIPRSSRCSGRRARCWPSWSSASPDASRSQRCSSWAYRAGTRPAAWPPGCWGMGGAPSLWETLFSALWDVCLRAVCVCVFLESVVVPSLLAGAAGMFPL